MGLYDLERGHVQMTSANERTGKHVFRRYVSVSGCVGRTQSNFVPFPYTLNTPKQYPQRERQTIFYGKRLDVLDSVIRISYT